jgi:hypothetical protein
MQKHFDDRDPGRPKAVTNADEQEVAVNHSTKEEGGYDEPVNSASTPAVSNTAKSQSEEVKKDEKPGKTPSKSNKNF